MTGTLSPSGARIRGDDYQHRFTWIQVLQALRSDVHISAIGVEDPLTPGADDVTVRHREGPDDFYQIKFSVDGRKIADLDWLIARSKAGPSILQKFFTLWKGSPDDPTHPRLLLVTNRLPDPADVFFSLLDGRSRTASARIRGTSPLLAALRHKLATHLATTQDTLLAFLENVSFILGKSHDEWGERARELMYVCGLRSDPEALHQGEAMVRGWVTSGRRTLQVDEIRQAVQLLGLQARGHSASLLIQAIDHDPFADEATVVLDWVDMFPGDDPRSRVLPRDPDVWNGRFRPALRQAARDLRAQGHRRVLVRGFARLPTWFSVGAELGRTAGFTVVSFRGEAPWSSDDTPTSFPVRVSHDEDIGEGQGLAIGVCVATDITADVVAYLRQALAANVGQYVALSPTVGASNAILQDAKQALGCAYAMRDHVRGLARELCPPTIHLFLAAPQGFALLLGHLWDRLPSTQLYEYRGSSGGYSPSFLIPS